jgi:DNA repair protein RadC
MESQFAEISINYISDPLTRGFVKITEPIAAVEELRSLWNNKMEYQESMYILLLDRANQVLGYQLLSLGSTTGVLVDIKMVLHAALLSNSHGVILAHNHPSGCVKPSHQDDKITLEVKKGLEAIDVKLLDHLIISPNDYYSYTSESNLLS